MCIRDSQKAGFVRTGGVVGNDENQHIYVVTAEGLTRLRRTLKEAITERRAVVWDDRDRQRFRRQLPARTRGAGRSRRSEVPAAEQSNDIDVA